MLKINVAVGVALALIALAPTKAIATCSSYPYTFTNGTTADANQMMSNLNYVGGCAAPIASPSFTGNVGIGTTTPAAPLDIEQVATGTSGIVSNATSVINLTPAASTSSLGARGWTGTVTFNGSNSITGGSGVYGTTGTVNMSQSAATTMNFSAGGSFTALNYSNGNTTTAMGVYGLTQSSAGTGTISNGSGGDFAVTNQSGATFTKATGVYTSIRNLSTGTVATGYGAFLDSPVNSGGGTLGTYYGLWIATPTAAATNYALYSQGGTNYFGGKVGIGTATPATQLHVTGGAIVDAPSTLTISASTFTPSAVGSNTFRAVLVHASCPCTIANPTGTAVDGARFTLEIWQSSTGGDTVSTWGSNYDFGAAGPPTLSTGANNGDFLGFAYSAQNSKYNYIGIQQGF